MKFGETRIFAIVKSVFGILGNYIVVDGREITTVVAVSFQKRSISKTALLAAISAIPRRSNIVFLVTNTIGDAIRDGYICIRPIRFCTSKVRKTNTLSSKHEEAPVIQR